jgi:cytochrome c
MLRRFVFLAPAAVAAATMLAPTATAQNNPGEQLFRQRCQSCHTVTPNGTPGPIGPNLRGVVGRQAASTGFKNYTPALKAAKITWTKEKLDQYLSGPARMVPGTRMVISVSDAKQRADLIAYLQTVR